MTTPPPQTESELVELVRASDVRAPASLHRQVDALLASRRRRRLVPPRRLLGAMAAAAAAGALVAALTGGDSPGLSLRQASALTLRPAMTGAPPESQTHRAELTAAVDGVSFPYWGERFGWHGAGARTDRVDGRTVTTVFYTDARGRRIGYAIVSGTPAPATSGGTIAWRAGVSYRLLSENGAPVVSWLRDGRLCVVSGRGLDRATLLRLASWSDRGSSTT